jgi:hypothetical protein
VIIIMVELVPINKIFQLWNPDERIDMNSTSLNSLLLGIQP